MSKSDLMTPQQMWEWVLANGQSLILIAGALLVVVLGLFLLPKLRRSRASKVGRAITSPLVLMWEAQGLHQLATTTGAKGVGAWIFASVTSAVLLTLALYADDHFRKSKEQSPDGRGNLGIPGRLVWAVAAPMGVIVALTAHTAAEAGLRVVLPILAAIVWWVEYAPVSWRSAKSAERREGGWRFSWRRIGVALGLYDPTDADLAQVNYERLIRRLVSLHRKQANARWFRSSRVARLERAAEMAQEEHIEEAHRRLDRSRNVVTRLSIPLTEYDTASDDDRQNGDRGNETNEDGRRARKRGRQPAISPTEEQDRAAARALYIEIISTGRTISEEGLANRFGRTRAWGRARVVDARAQLAESVGVHESTAREHLEHLSPSAA